jgi:putative transposase
MLRWAAEHRVHLHFIQPGKPTQNANAESLNGRIRDELFNLRPHSAIGYRTPKEFADVFKINPPSQLSAA